MRETESRVSPEPTETGAQTATRGAGTVELKRIGIASALRISFFLSWAVGALVAVVYGLLFLFASRFNPESFDAQLRELGVETSGVLFVVLGGFFLSILCAFVGAVGGGMFALLYNGLARVIGGLSFELGGVGPAVIGRPDPDLRPISDSRSPARSEGGAADPAMDHRAPDRGSVQQHDP